MRLVEWQGKRLLRQQGIPVPRGSVVASPEELEDVSLPFPWMLKAQVPAGKRGNAGGIIRADDVDMAQDAARKLLDGTLHGFSVNEVLVEEYLPHEEERYLAVTVDRKRGMPLLLYGQHGGVDVEEQCDVLRLPVHPLAGLQPYQLRQLGDMADVARKLYHLFRAYDCRLAEINPLADVDGSPMALDAKIEVDDNALFRQDDIPWNDHDMTPLEREARDAGLAFVELDGNIGVIANGAGLTMATLDALQQYGGRGMFLDLAGTDSPDTVKKAFSIMQRAAPDVIFVNLFGGITKCDTVARGILDAVEETNVDVPVVARIRGTNERRASTMLQGQVVAVRSFQMAAQRAAELGGKT
ncbi:MAG: ADP-forming succinate--CoA ligase subunit beta [Candidatus Thermoplasmatota archaeon]|nr:ADP-forming succinate--CoA ligase subunit beta [Candidatus Thermoplasmatota archaeon]